MLIKNYLLAFLTIGLFLEMLLIPRLPAQAQLELKTQSYTSQRIIFNEDFEPPTNGGPKDSTGAGSRDGQRCSQNEQQIRALMPKRNYGLTLEERPSIFVDLPKTSAKQVVLAFQDETGKFYQRAVLPITANARIVNFSLPTEKQALVVGKNYQWSLVVVCGQSVQPDDPTLRGWVQRVARIPQLERELRQKSVIEQVMWYGESGYWYDMVKVLAQARQEHPDNVKLNTVWQDLLESVGLGAIRFQPLQRIASKPPK